MQSLSPYLLARLVQKSVVNSKVIYIGIPATLQAYAACFKSKLKRAQTTRYLRINNPQFSSFPSYVFWPAYPLLAPIWVIFCRTGKMSVKHPFYRTQVYLGA